MKHSIRFIQVNYSRGDGKTILFVRGMEIREYSYSTRRFDAILDTSDRMNFESHSYDTKITFTRNYPNS